MRNDLWYNALLETFRSWKSDDNSQYAAGLAFFSILSFAPLLVLILALISVILHNQVSNQDFLRTLERDIGVSGLDIVSVRNIGVGDPNANVLAIIIGSILALLGSLNVVLQLRHMLNRLLVEPTMIIQQGWHMTFRTYTVSIFFVIILTILITLFFVSGLVITTVSTMTETFFPYAHFFWFIVDVLVSAITFITFFILSIRYLPHTTLPWGPLMHSALLTALLFILGKWGINLYIQYSSFNTIYGTAGSLIALLLWIYYSAQIFLFGVEFAKALHHYQQINAKNASLLE